MSAVTYIEAPEELSPDGVDRPALFLAGGITGCDDWQRRVAEELSDTGIVILNPRRRNFPIHDPSAAEAQIGWEFRHLRRATARLFWFPPQTLCPIALYELGAWAGRPGTLFVGTDPAYARRSDVILQLRLARPEVNVTDSLEAMVKQVRTWAGECAVEKT
jgi:hypothetical protein